MMELRYPVITLIILVLAWCCIAGCTSSGTSKPAMPAKTPEVTLHATQTVTIDLTAKNMAFNQSTITVPAGAAVVVNFSNQEAPGSSQVTGIAHNFAVYDSPAATTAIFRGEIITGGTNATYRFTAPDTPGTYLFRCDVHPSSMTGTFVVR